MRIPKITEVNNTIEIMRKAYNFYDDETIIELTKDMCNHNSVIELRTTDKATDTVVTLTRRVVYDKLVERGSE